MEGNETRFHTSVIMLLIGSASSFEEALVAQSEI